ncbi:helix-turn-helix domain-containing protein [Megasphaera sp.]
MDQNHFTTDTLRKKGAHLTFEERVIIQTRLRDKQSYRSIAREIGCCVNTVRNEVKRGKVLCYIMGPLSRPRSKILRVAVSRIILSSEASKVKLVGNLVA